MVNNGKITMKTINDRCGIFIDIEGTKSNYYKNESHFYNSLDVLLSSALMAVRFELSKNNEFFLHQMGVDGLFLISRNRFDNYEFPISLSIYIMQKILITSSVGKCGISLGDFSDIQSCLPLTREQVEISNSYPTGGGMCSKINVMGSALINSYVLTGKPSGSLLSIAETLVPNIPKGIIYKEIDTKFIIDWIHTNTESLNFIFKTLGEEKPSVDELENRLSSYIDKNLESLDNEWVENTISLNGLSADESKSAQPPINLT